MSSYLLAKIKDQDQFKQVFPLPIDGDNNLARFIQSILGKTIQVRKVSNIAGSFCYVSDIDPRCVIMPSWIEYFDTEKLVPTCSGQEDCIGLVVYWDGTLIVLGR